VQATDNFLLVEPTGLTANITQLDSVAWVCSGNRQLVECGDGIDLGFV
jgi:hypothetical protein